jgi:hypothetical protein
MARMVLRMEVGAEAFSPCPLSSVPLLLGALDHTPTPGPGVSPTWHIFVVAWALLDVANRAECRFWASKRCAKLARGV